jgi:archaellum component FlaC
MYDFECATLSPKRLKRMSVESKNVWRCLECKSKQPKLDNTNTPVRSTTQYVTVPAPDDESYSESNITLRKKSTCVTDLGLKELFKAERLQTKAIVEASYKGLSDQLKGINVQFTNFQESLTYINGQYEDLKKEISDLKKLLKSTSLEVKSLKDENKRLKEDVTACSARITELELENRKQQQWQRLQNLELVNIPENREENLLNIVVKTVNHVGAAIQPIDIEFAHRVQPRRAVSASRARPIIVRFKQRSVKDRVIAAARKQRNMSTRDIGFGGDESRIYINEHLIKENKMLLGSCRQKARDSGYKYVWTKNCRIYVRKNDTSTPFPIDSLSDLEKIL